MDAERHEVSAALYSRLMAKYTLRDDGCWEWIGAVGGRSKGAPRWQGYGVIRNEIQRMEYAHCVSYRLHKGPIPIGMMVCHSCDFKLCGNPRHLFLGTNQDNLEDCVRKGRHRACKLTETQVDEILASVEPDVVLAAKYSVRPNHINRIRKGLRRRRPK